MHVVINCSVLLFQLRIVITVLVTILMIVSSYSSKAIMIPFTSKNIVNNIVGSICIAFGGVSSVSLSVSSTILRHRSSTCSILRTSTIHKLAFVQQSSRTRSTTTVSCRNSQLRNNNDNENYSTLETNNNNNNSQQKQQVQQYVFGYGSLICSNSRSMTTKNDNVSTTTTTALDTIQVPVQVFGMKRIWCKRSIRGMTSMGIVFANNTTASADKKVDEYDIRRDDNDENYNNSQLLSTTASASASVSGLSSTSSGSSTTGSTVGGVLVPVTDNELQLYDLREVGYTRYQIPIENIQLVQYLSYNKSNYNNINNYDDDDEYNLNQQYYMNTIYLLQTLNNNNNNINNDNKLLKTHTTIISTIPISERNSYNTTTTKSITNNIQNQNPIIINVWVYIPNEIHLPTYNYPIVQSYLDTILRGCFNIHEQFAIDYILSTYGWYNSNYTSNSTFNTTSYWINDRTTPIYPRGDIQWSNMYGTKIVDTLLQQYIPECYSNRINS